MGSRKSSRPSITCIPEEIMVEILLLLPIKAIVMCKSTCKGWRYLISSTHFAELHQVRAQETILIRNRHGNWEGKEISRIFYVIDPSEINSSYCGCNNTESAKKINLKLDAKLKIPLHNEEMFLNDSFVSVNHGYINVTNSCNGLLCLSTPYSNIPIVVCNPVTNEYIKLPRGSFASVKYSGFGFCPKTEQYKVIRIKTTNCEPFAETEIHTLGTNYWRSIGTLPNPKHSIDTSLYLNGALYWCYGQDVPNHSIDTHLYLNGAVYWCYGQDVLSFEFNDESFTLLPPPPIDLHEKIPCLRKFRDSLSLYVCISDTIEIFVFGVQKSWSKLITMPNPYCLLNAETQLTSCSKCDEFLLFCCREDWIKVFDPKRKAEKNLRIHRYISKIEALVYTPSFISLKDVVPGGAKIQSISTGFLLPREIKALYLREDTRLGQRK